MSGKFWEVPTRRRDCWTGQRKKAGEVVVAVAVVARRWKGGLPGRRPRRRVGARSARLATGRPPGPSLGCEGGGLSGRSELVVVVWRCCCRRPCCHCRCLSSSSSSSSSSSASSQCCCRARRQPLTPAVRCRRPSSHPPGRPRSGTVRWWGWARHRRRKSRQRRTGTAAAAGRLGRRRRCRARPRGCARRGRPGRWAEGAAGP